MSKNFVNRSRKKMLEALLQDDYVMVHLATGVEGLVIPDHLMRDSTVTLKLSFWFKGKLTLGDDGAHANLSFGGVSYDCFIPYKAIWAVTSFNGSFELWDNEMKDQLTKVIAPERAAAAKKEPDSEAPKPQLSLASETSEETVKAKSKKKNPRPLLRLVK